MQSPAAGQDWDASRYAAQARFVAELGMPVVELLAPRPGERILDLGCGDGALTARLAELGCEVIGVDADPTWCAPPASGVSTQGSPTVPACPSRRSSTPCSPTRRCTG